MWDLDDLDRDLPDAFLLDMIRPDFVPPCVPPSAAVDGPRVQEKSGKVRSDNRQETVRRSERTYVYHCRRNKKSGVKELR